MDKCPACGYTADINANYSKKIGGLLRDRSPATRKLMNKIAGKINKNVPSETRIKYFHFLYGIKDIDDEVIVRFEVNGNLNREKGLLAECTLDISFGQSAVISLLQNARQVLRQRFTEGVLLFFAHFFEGPVVIGIKRRIASLHLLQFSVKLMVKKSTEKSRHRAEVASFLWRRFRCKRINNLPTRKRNIVKHL